MERQTSACRTRAVRLSALLFAGLLASSLVTPHAALALSELKQIPGEVSQDKKTKDVPPEEKPRDKAPMQIPMPV